MDAQKIWDHTLGFIEDRMGRDVVDMWLHPVRLEKLDATTATIVVPNKFFGDWLGRNYRELLSEAICSVNGAGHQGKDIEVIFVVGETGENRLQVINKPLSENLPQEGMRTRRAQLPNCQYTFDSFIVGASNQFAHAASLAVAESIKRVYNPFFIYGGVGLGKTHLLNAIGNHVASKSDLRIAYVTTEQFTNEVINSIRYDKMIELRRRYRNVDMLLIDDIQFLAGKERTQEEFFHTFNTLYEARKQIVLSSDRFPKEMPTMEERLRSRFAWGLIADLQPPDVETRIAILRKKSEDQGIVIREEIIQLLAASLKSNIRELEGALVRLGAYASLTGQPITVDMTKHVLRDLLGNPQKVITLGDVQEAVAIRFHVKVSDLKSKRRTKTMVHPRQIAMYLSRELTNASYPEIGRSFGGKDHTTIIHACKQMEKALERDSTFRSTMEGLKDDISKA